MKVQPSVTYNARLAERTAQRMPGIDLAALHEALDAATLAAFIAETADRKVTAEALAISAHAADMAFPPNSPGLGAFKIILSVIYAGAR